MLAVALQKIAVEYPGAQREKFADHPLADFIRTEARTQLERSSAIQGQGLICKGSPGNGNFAAVPWLAMFDPLVTTSAVEGYYVVYLYSANGDLYLSLNQGTTAVRREFGAEARNVLKDRAALICARLPEFTPLLPQREIDLGSMQKLPRDYEAGHAFGARYRAGEDLDSERLAFDLGNAIAAYRALRFRGGLDPSPEASERITDELGDRGPLSLLETRRYRLHRKIERNARAAGLAKLVHGTECQVCDFDFRKTYGELGDGFIEAHHLRPLGTLDEGSVVKLSAEHDFAVLCSNCHRMIHRMEDPSDLAALRALLAR